MAQTDVTGNSGKTMDAYNARLTGVENRLDTVEGTLVTHGTKLDQIITAVTKNEAARGPGLSEMIRTGSSLATAGAIIAALLIYVITSVMAAPLTTLKERQTVINERTERVDKLALDLAITQERLRVATQRLDSGEFLRGWQATVAYNKPGS